MTEAGQIKLGDLNVSKIAKRGLLHTRAGTPYYASPEVWRGQPYDSKSDIWSLGCVLYEAAALHPPFLGNNMKELCQKIVLGKYIELPNRYSCELNLMISSLLQLDPKLRPSCSKCLSILLVDIMRMPSIAKRIDDELVAIAYHQALLSGEMLRTILLPQTLRVLGKQLPKPNYTILLKQSSNSQKEQKEVQEPIKANIVQNSNEQPIKPKLEDDIILNLPLLPASRP